MFWAVNSDSPWGWAYEAYSTLYFLYFYIIWILLTKNFFVKKPHKVIKNKAVIKDSWLVKVSEDYGI